MKDNILPLIRCRVMYFLINFSYHLCHIVMTADDIVRLCCDGDKRCYLLANYQKSVLI